MASSPPNPPGPPTAAAAAIVEVKSGEGGEGHYKAYEEHAKTLRTWLVAYGIGGPVLILSEETVWKRLSEGGALRCIAELFLAGVVLQVILAAINKSAMWACYFGEIDPPCTQSWRYKLGLWLSERYIIDFRCDLISMGLFAAATYLAFSGLLP